MSEFIVANKTNEPDYIKFTNKVSGETYTLQFSRASALFAQDRGFNPDEIAIKPARVIPDLFFYAMKKNGGKTHFFTLMIIEIAKMLLAQSGHSKVQSTGQEFVSLLRKEKYDASSISNSEFVQKLLYSSTSVGAGPEKRHSGTLSKSMS